MLFRSPTPPYQRPPLSKTWLMGELSAESLLLRAPDFYDKQRIALKVDMRVTSIDRTLRQVALSDGSFLGYGHLILATGARARLLPVPGCELRGTLLLRDTSDARVLQAALRPGRRLVIVGAGYVGLETAATARKLGVDVVEREARLLSRMSSAALSDFFEARHRHAGVEFVLQAPPIECFQGRNGAVCAVVLRDGRTLECDAVLVGVGAEANDDLARAAGLVCDQGVVVNEHARTSDPRVYAIGDVSHRPLPFSQRSGRLESVANALEQARQAASSIAGRFPPPPEVPWFWSDQYEYKLQIAGLPFDADRMVQRTSASGDRMAIFHLQQERLVAVETVNALEEFLAGKKLIASGRPVDAVRLADPSISMKDVMPAQPQEAYT